MSSLEWSVNYCMDVCRRWSGLCYLLYGCLLSLEWSTLGLYVVAGVVCYLLYPCMLSLEWSTLGLYVVAGVVC